MKQRTLARQVSIKGIIDRVHFNATTHGVRDIDDNRLRARGEKYPDARLFNDYRKMLEEMKNLDAVIVATPDHHHAPASVRAMNMGAVLLFGSSSAALRECCSASTKRPS